MRKTVKNLLKLGTLILFLIVHIEVQSQDTRSSLPGIDNTSDFLKNPSTSKFTDYSNQQLVDLYTGMINYTIPVYSIKSADLKVPINLSYKSDGVLIEEDASWVGLGLESFQEQVILNEKLEVIQMKKLRLLVMKGESITKILEDFMG